MYQHCPNPFSTKQRRKSFGLSPESFFWTSKQLFAIHFLLATMFAPWRCQSSLRITWVSDYWQIIHCGQGLRFEIFSVFFRNDLTLAFKITTTDTRFYNLCDASKSESGQIDISFLCVCPVIIDNEFRHNIVKVVCGCTRLSPRGSTATLTML